MLAPGRLEDMTGTPAGFVPDQREHAELQNIIGSLFPVAPRAPGTIYDGYVGNLDIASYPFERLEVPTLVVAAEDDTLAPYKTRVPWPIGSPAPGSSASPAVATPSPTSIPTCPKRSRSSSPRPDGVVRPGEGRLRRRA